MNRQDFHNDRDFKCEYLEEKPERDAVREKVWAKIDTVDEVIKQTYNALEEFQREIKTADGAQDKHIEELKAMLQELAASQHGTDEEMQQIKMQIGTLRSDIADLRSHLDNGFTDKVGNEVTSKLLNLIEIMNQNSYTIKKTEQEIIHDTETARTDRRKYIIGKVLEILGTAVTSGGIIYLIIERTT
jgi:prophage DNA circulation protein